MSPTEGHLITLVPNHADTNYTRINYAPPAPFLPLIYTVYCGNGASTPTTPDLITPLKQGRN